MGRQEGLIGLKRVLGPPRATQLGGPAKPGVEAFRHQPSEGPDGRRLKAPQPPFFGSGISMPTFCLYCR